MPEFPFAVRFVKTPLTFVLSTVRPYLSAWTVSSTVFKVTSVDSSVFEHKLFNKCKTFFVSLAFKFC